MHTITHLHRDNTYTTATALLIIVQPRYMRVIEDLRIKLKIYNTCQEVTYFIVTWCQREETNPRQTELSTASLRVL